MWQIRSNRIHSRLGVRLATKFAVEQIVTDFLLESKPVALVDLQRADAHLR